MGEALAMGMVNSAYAKIDDIIIAEPLAERAEHLRETSGFHVVSDGAKAAPEAGKVVIAVKPQVLGVVLDGLKDALAHGPLLISIVAGAPTSRFIGILGDEARIVRVMPNTPALVGEGAAGLCARRRGVGGGFIASETTFGVRRQGGGFARVVDGCRDGFVGQWPRVCFPVHRGPCGWRSESGSAA